MKKPLLFLLSLALVFSFALTASAANSITNRLKGRLLLQVQKGGAIWYVNPNDSQKYQVTFANALNLFQNFALGITNADLLKIPVDLDSIYYALDSDNDGYSDKQELQNGYSPYIPGSNKGRFKTDNNLANRLKGKLLLQVEQGGAIWYVDINGIRHNVRWNNLMDLFTRLALGITDKDLETVGNAETANWKTYTNSEYGFEFKYPKDWGEVVFEERNCVEGGSLYRAKFSLNKEFVFGGNSDNCSEGRGAGFLDFVNYRFSGDRIIYKLAFNKEDSVKPSGTVILENGDKAVLLYDQDLGLQMSIGDIGAYINLKNKKFTGLAFFANEGRQDLSILKNILSTFKFTDETSNWIPLKSNYFTLSFKIPSGFEFKEGQNYILVAETPYFTREIGDDNAFFNLTRYNQYDTRESQIVLYRKLLKNIQESTIVIDNSSFIKFEGDDWGRFEGDSAGKVTVVFFDASWLEIIERPANSDQSFNPITIGNQILSSFKFSK